jgi:hypothetical protein
MSDAAAIVRAHPREADVEVAVPFGGRLPEHARREAGAVLEEAAYGPCTIPAEVDGEVVGLVEVPELAVALNRHRRVSAAGTMEQRSRPSPRLGLAAESTPSPPRPSMPFQEPGEKLLLGKMLSERWQWWECRRGGRYRNQQV